MSSKLCHEPPASNTAARIHLLESLVILMLVLGCVRAAEIVFGVRFVARFGLAGRTLVGVSFSVAALAFLHGVPLPAYLLDQIW